MKTKPIILPDPLKLDAEGVSTTRQAGVLVHLARCGLTGSTIPAISKSLKLPASSVAEIVEHLRERDFVTPYGRCNSQGRAWLFIVTVKAWKMLSTPVDFGMYPQAEVVP